METETGTNILEFDQNILFISAFIYLFMCFYIYVFINT